MLRKISVFTLVLALSLVFALPAFAQQPNFGPAVYADGEVFGTKDAAIIPPPTGNNLQSFDALYVVTNSNNPGTQLPVAEAAPGNTAFNGGRWATKTVVWTQAGFDDHGTVPLLMSQDDIDLHASLGHLEIMDGSPGGPGAPPDYFECPLLPVKEG